ncbi:MAG: zinc ribbon domain-containing protein, partial [Deltaproteobacteria bacterium]|nr:zinc ribbon domain-containing protein [Deltaproteobacteria bacterium]
MPQSTRKVSAKELAEDIKSGLGTEDLMKKYGVSAQGLQRLLNQLLQNGLINEEDLSNLMRRGAETRCSGCGKLNELESKFCSGCGANLGATRGEPQSSKDDNRPNVSGTVKTSKKGLINGQVSGKQRSLGIVFVVFPVIIFLLARLGLGSLGEKPPYTTSGELLYICLAVLTIVYGLFSVWLLWGVFKPIASGLTAVKETSSPERLPDSFLELDPANRKLALNLMWSSGLGLASREAAAAGSTIMARYGVPGAGWLGKILLFWFGGGSWLGGMGMCVAIVGSLLKPSPNDQVTDIPWMFLASTALLMFGALVIAFYHFVSFFVDKLLGVVSKAERTAHHSAAHHQKLKKLATSFIGTRYATWFEDMKRSAQAMALSEAGMTPESTFLLFSQPTSLGSDGVPSRRNVATYIFSNGHVAAVSNVVFDMEA